MSEETDPKAKILVIEDDPNSMEAVCFLLGKMGHEIIRASDGEEGWRLFCRHRPDIVISDIMMPRLNGLELLKKVREFEDTMEKTTTPVMLLTAKDSDQDILHGYKERADYYITKPFSEAQLKEGLRIIMEALEEDKRTREARDRTTWTLE
jgi:DNA-binding response OmpR family regulator